MSKIYHCEIFGLREKKYNWLNKHSIKNVKWNKLEPQTPFYLFIPRDVEHLKEYKNFISVQEIFPVNVTGIVTARDKLVIDFDELVLKRRMEEFRSLLIDDSTLKNRYHLKDTRGWEFTKARKALAKDEEWNNYFTKILYRPFDVRSIYYSEKMVDWGRQEVLRHMLEPNISLCFMRQVSTSELYTQVLVSEYIVDNRTFFSSKGIIQQAPLFIYPETDKKDLFSEHESGEKKPNIKPELFEELKSNFKKEITPEEIFYYIYAILYSNSYRKKYEEFLKIDFPRIPFTKDYKIFIQLGKLGYQLAELHLLKSKELDKAISKFPVEGNNKVEKPVFKVETGHAPSLRSGKVYINKNQFFDGVTEEVWNYQIGGYQVCEKWLKDRKGRTLTLDDVKTYFKIVTALSKTIGLQKEIDKIYEAINL